MNRDQMRFLGFGLFFGFVLGYIVAFGVHDDALVRRPAPVPAAGNMGMSPGNMGGMGGNPGHAGVPGMGGEESMAHITEEIAGLKEAVKSDPNNIDALMRLAQMFSQVGMFDRFDAFYAENVPEPPKDPAVLVRLANLFHDNQKFERAIEYYRAALDGKPDDVNARTDMAICLYQLERVDDALAEFRRSLSFDPKHWQTWLNLGLVSLREKGDVATASEAFAKVEELNPHYEGLPMLKETLEKARAGARTSPS